MLNAIVRFYSNENLPFAIVKALRELGYDVLTSREAGNANQGIPDEEVLAYATATANNRIVITLNRDDFIALHRSGIHHGGIIVCKDNREYQAQAEVIHKFLSTVTQSMTNQLIRVLKRNQPKSDQQVFVIRDYNREV